MMRLNISRFLAASLSLCFALLINIEPSPAAQQVTTGDPGGGMSCWTCSTPQNSVTLAGTATGGAVTDTDTGEQFDIHYSVPNDGQMYSGQLMTEVENADGSVTVNTYPISDYANGSTSGYATMPNDSFIPIGGSGSITINETAPNGASFSAGWTIRNYHP